ncbi:AAA family ATPase [Lysinibacillus halotolerans]|uniref:Nuclease SbcCD subunit C n=1 Tax=Lysinibacillus halotolerans TaxID=1368476 RepID=A0A3M8H9G0_9BACI|nr:AAA family ATPase [Lysinibacillus halotolerans]RNC99077.1 SMC family ATPase [Lysinibacillus halotolerans]
MKPIKLTLRAFGPYKNEEVIDFTELQDNRLFVISGSTGAGKTTIFDGICFALYGFGSGQDRKDTKMLRSDFAEDNVHTAVELIFEIHGKIYRILRQLPHVKEGRKTATGEKYELFEIVNGQEIPAVERQKVTDINDKIENIIGLTYDQFSQIVMLPQGEFRKLLTSQSDNKEAILRKIFKTNRYGEMTQKLEEKKKLADQELDRARTLKNSYVAQIAGALPRRDSTLFTVLDQNSNIYQIQDALVEEIQYYQQKIKDDQKNYEQAVENHHEKYNHFLAAKALNDRIDSYEKKKLTLQQLEQQKPLYEQKKKEYEAAISAGKIQPLNQQCHALYQDKVKQQQILSEMMQRLEQAKRDLTDAQNAYERESLKQSERDALTQKVNELQKLVPLYEQIEKQNQIVHTLETEVQGAKTIFEKVDKQLATEKEQMARINGLVEQLEEKTGNLNELLEQQVYLREVVNTFARYKELVVKANQFKEQYEKIVEEYNAARKDYELEEKKWLSNQAALLATNLIPGTPCPVCGSTDHQQVNLNHEEAVDENSLRNRKSLLASVEQRKYSIEANYNTLQEQVKKYELELGRLKASIDNEDTFIQQLSAVNENVQQVKLGMDKLAQYKKQLKQMKENYEQLERIRKQTEETFRQKNEQLLKENIVLSEQQKSIPPHLQELSQLQQVIQETEFQKNALLAQWEKVQKHLLEVEKFVATTEEGVKQTTKNIEHLEEKLKHAKEQFKQSMAVAGFDNYKQFESALRTDDEIQSLYQLFMEFSNELHSISTQVKEESIELEGKQKVDLTIAEAEVQSLKDEYEKALQRLNTSKDCERHAIDFSEKLDHVADQIFQLEEKSNQIINLYNLLRGQNSKKISFERYVQMGYLEQITEAANIRLKNLSNGQYYLQCSDRQESHGRQSGLSLDVYDTYTGQSRDVKSLSGGEKFNASLCLALGMADVIQSFQGNVKIDTMFIDEGFGSLDEESLMKAIDTLIDLQKSGRMIGVISHVSELKAAMPAILQVEKLKEGYSKTSIVVK